MRQKGDRGEVIAVQYLQEKGYHILARNFHARIGEIDIIAKDKECLVFVEVKNYDSTSIHPLEVMTPSKMKRFRKAAEIYLYRQALQDIDCRFDLIVVSKDQVSHQYCLDN